MIGFIQVFINERKGNEEWEVQKKLYCKRNELMKE